MDLEHERRLTEVESKAARNEGRIKKLEGEHEALNNLATAVAVMAEKQDTTNKNLATLSEKVDSIEGKPAERWDKLISTIIGALAGAFIAWVATGAPGLN